MTANCGSGRSQVRPFLCAQQKRAWLREFPNLLLHGARQSARHSSPMIRLFDFSLKRKYEGWHLRVLQFTGLYMATDPVAHCFNSLEGLLSTRPYGIGLFFSRWRFR